MLQLSCCLQNHRDVGTLINIGSRCCVVTELNPFCPFLQVKLDPQWAAHMIMHMAPCPITPTMAWDPCPTTGTAMAWDPCLATALMMAPWDQCHMMDHMMDQMVAQMGAPMEFLVEVRYCQ